VNLLVGTPAISTGGEEILSVNNELIEKKCMLRWMILGSQ